MESISLPKLRKSNRKGDFWVQNKEPVIKELRNFEEGVTQIIQKVKFRKIKCQVQKELNDDITSVKCNNCLFVKADK